MPMIQNSVSVAAASVNDNILANSQWEYLPYNARLEFGLVGDANAADLRVDVYSGTDVILEGSPLSAQNRMPIYPDDFTLTDFAAAGERIKIRVRNTNAGAARTVFFCVRINPA
jgi:hypothetical protein